MSNTAYTPQPSPIAPTTAQTPYANQNVNPVGSQYASDYSHDTSLLIQRAIVREIFDATPQKYKALRLLFDKPVEFQPLDEFTYLEKTFGRTALVANANVTAGATQTLTLTAGGVNNITINKIIVYPNNTHAIVTAVNAGSNQISVKPANGAGNLPAVTSGDLFSIQGGLIADGMNFFMHYDRMSTVERYNYIMLLQRDKRWTRMELQKHLNAGTTNYLDLDKREQAELLYQDMYASFINGVRGEFDVTVPGTSNVYKAKSMGGIYPLMVAAGSAHTSTAASGLVAAFESLAFSTDYKSEGGVRYILGTPAMLYKMSTLFKDPIQYTPNDKIADLNLQEYRIGEMRFVPVPQQIFGETSMFPTSFANKLIVLDMDTIQPVCMTGYLPVEMGETPDKKTGGAREDYKEWWMQACLSLKFNNPLSSFYIDVTA